MKAKLQLGVCVLLHVFTSMPLCAAIRYVNVANPTPLAPYTNWTTAANIIQHAVDVAVAGDEVVVTNGAYQLGGRAVDPRLTNRVAVTKALTVRSVNGPEVTVIRGYQVPGTTNGAGAIRCVYLTNGAALVGFTLRDGATAPHPSHPPAGGDSYYYDASSGGGAYSWSSTAIVSNCIFIGNSAGFGGAAAFVALRNCVVTRNVGAVGGGTYESSLNNCTVTGNSAQYAGGGDCRSTMNNCIVYFNTVEGEVNNAVDSSLNFSCTTPLPTNGVGNIAADPQLASFSHLGAGSPCRGTGSPAYARGVDIDGEAWANPPSMGCDESHPGSASGPLTVAFQTSFTNVGVDFAVEMTAQITGHAVANRWELGDGTVLSNRLTIAHKWSAPGKYRVILRAFNDHNPAGESATRTVHVANPMVHYVASESTNPTPPYTSWHVAARTIQEAVDVAVPGSEIVVSNGVYRTGGRAMYGTMTNRLAITKPLTVRSANGPDVTVIRGEQASTATNGNDAVRCVYLAKRATLIGFALVNGATLTIGHQSHELSGGGLWSASQNAVASNCVFSGNAAEWVGGGAVSATLIHCRLINNSSGRAGGGAHASTLINCTVSDNASHGGGGASFSILADCTISWNFAQYGGGVWGGTLSNCTLSKNYATGRGGGAMEGDLNNCVINGNSAQEYGGGASGGTLKNCVVTDNSAYEGGGGVLGGIVQNCIVFDNHSLSEANYSGWDYQTLAINYSCTTPLPAQGVGNITNAPLFVAAAAGNFRLQPNSPCINAGRNEHVADGSDLDGNPRIAGGTVDLGAYEFQSPQSALSYAWLQQYGLPTDGSADITDPDDDGLNNWQECRAGTDPTHSASALRLLPPLISPNGLLVRWQSVTGRKYSLERRASLETGPFSPIASNIPGQAGTTIVTDTNAVDAGPLFYRVGVSE